jgi:carboxyl-terminal processing protease
MGLKQHLRKVFIIVPLAGLTLFTSSYVDSYFEISKNLDIFISLYKELHLYYVDETQPGKLMEQGINGMLESLDPYTNFISQSDIEDYRVMNIGQCGIGALIRKKGEHVMMAEPYYGFGADLPAQ